MEEQGYTEDEIDAKVSALRKELLSKMDDDVAPKRLIDAIHPKSTTDPELPRLVPKGTHEIAAVSILKNSVFKDALGISEDYEDGSSLKMAALRRMPAVSNSSNGQQPLLPLTFSPVCKSQKSQSHGRSISFSKARSAAGGTSLLVVAFMILAWATIIPLPDFEISSRSLSNPVASVAGIVPSPVSSPTLFPGRSRTLLARSDPDKLGGLPPDQPRPDKLDKVLNSFAPQEATSPNPPFPTSWIDEPPESSLIQRRDAIAPYAMEDL
nr:unnamed protein product [Spirometra erinaceieuropaei]